MTNPRSGKRNRNKSSPQVDNSPKKQRSQIDGSKFCDTLTETEEQVGRLESVDLEDSVSFVDSVGLTKKSTETIIVESDPKMASACSDEPIADSSMDTTISAADTSESSVNGDSQVIPSTPYADQVHQQLNLHSVMPTPPPPPPAFISQTPIMDPGLCMQQGPQMNLHPQMLQLANQMPIVPQSNGLSDADILRVALQIKAILREEIEDLVRARVELAIQPLQNELTSVRAELVSVKSELKKLQQTVKQVITKTDDLEQYSRRSCLRIAGIAEEQGEDVRKIVMDLANRVEADIRPDDIDRAHRVGKPRIMGQNGGSQGNTNAARVQRGREIIVKFQSHTARLNFLRGRAKLRDARAKIFITEDLTKLRNSLAFECRQLKRDKQINKTWIYGGNVYINDLNNTKLSITSQSDLDLYKAQRPGLQVPLPQRNP